VRDERKRQEIWEVEDESFSHLIVGFNGKDFVRFITAVARQHNEVKRVAHTAIGGVANAHQAGGPAIKNFTYEWRLAPQKGSGESLLITRGRDPEYLSTYSLKRLAAN